MAEITKTLINTLSIFSEELDLDREQNLGSLELSVKNGYIDFNDLRSEYFSALNDSTFNWLNLPAGTELFYIFPQK